MWNIGHRPPEVVAAVTRRSNHLAHTAITRKEPWLIETVRAYHHSHPTQTDTAPLRRLVTDIAAYRERNHITGTDPLGPNPNPTDPRQTLWRHLHDQLHTTPAPRISDALLEH